MARTLATACLLAGLAPYIAAAQGGEVLMHGIEEAIFLASKNSRTVIAARLGREEQAFDLEETEERYDLQARVFGLSTNGARYNG